MQKTKSEKQSSKTRIIPWLLFNDLLFGKDLSSGSPLVGGNRHTLGRVRVADDQNVVPPAKRVAEDGLRVQNHLTVGAGRLARAGSVVIPPGQLLGVLDGLRQRAGLGAEIRARPTDPDVLCNNLLGMILQREGQELVQGRHGAQPRKPPHAPPNAAPQQRAARAARGRSICETGEGCASGSLLVYPTDRGLRLQSCPWMPLNGRCRTHHRNFFAFPRCPASFHNH